MAVHKPKLKNVPHQDQEAFVQHHLPYELWMMREALAAARRGAPTRFLQNLQVEGFALHARNMIEFLKNGDSCGFNPTDFTTKVFSVDRMFIRPTLVDMINEQISHLTSDRTKNQAEKFDEPHWDETADAIEREFQRWINNLTPHWVAKWQKRERMGEVASTELNIKVNFSGACTAPVFLSTNATEPTEPASYNQVTGPTGPGPTPDQ